MTPSEGNHFSLERFSALPAKHPEVIFLSYTVSDFRASMPAFTAELAPDTLVETYIAMAAAVVLENRWHALWREGMRLFVAHFLTLYLASSPEGEGRGPLVEAGRRRGSVTSETAGEVSVSYAAAETSRGWGCFFETAYGRQFATLARALGRPCLYVP